MLKKTVVRRPAIKKIKSVKKISKDVAKKSKTVQVDTETKVESAEKKPKITRSKEKFSEEIKELEDKFNIKAEVALNAVEGIITLTANDPNLKKKLFSEQFPVFLQVNSLKVPRIYSKIVRLPVEHSILPPDADVCLIVADVKGIPNKEHEQHVEHYEKLLQSKNVTNIKKIMTFHELRTEYEAFEMKRRLVDLYDFFLVDGRISGKTVKKCGKIFYTKRKVPTAIKLHVSKLKEHIDQALTKTPLYLSGKGDSFMVQVGHNAMKEKHIVENIFSVLKGLDKEFPGGFSNVRSLYLHTLGGITVPLYLTLKNKTDVEIVKKEKKPKRVGTVSGELTTLVNTGVVVKPTGEVRVFRIGCRYKEGDKPPPEQKNAENPKKQFNKRKLDTANNNSQGIKKRRSENNAQNNKKGASRFNKRKVNRRNIK